MHLLKYAYCAKENLFWCLFGLSKHEKLICSVLDGSKSEEKLIVKKYLFSINVNFAHILNTVACQPHSVFTLLKICQTENNIFEIYNLLSQSMMLLTQCHIYLIFRRCIYRIQRSCSGVLNMSCKIMMQSENIFMPYASSRWADGFGLLSWSMFLH